MFGERFTHRFEAFSDLVFGFSLSLLAMLSVITVLYVVATELVKASFYRGRP